MKQHLRFEPHFLDQGVTYDESWVYHFDPCSKQELIEYRRADQPPKKKAQKAKSVGKIMLIPFFDKKGMIYQHIVPTTKLRTNVTKKYYIGVLRTLRKYIQWKWQKSPKISSNSRKNSSLNAVLRFCLKPPILLIWSPAISGCFRPSRKCCVARGSVQTR